MSTSTPGSGPTPDPTPGAGDRGAGGVQGQAPDPYGQPYGQSYGQAPDPYGQGAHGQGAAAPAPRNGLGIAALVVGIVALLVGIIPVVGVLGLVGLVAVVLGIVALKRVRQGVATNRGVSITGIVLGGLATLAAVVWIVLIIVVGSSGVGQNFGQVVEDCSQVPAEQQQECIEDGLDLQP